MKTFETEKQNIPEGATHYRDECEDYKFSWIKYDSSGLLVDSEAIGGWIRFKCPGFDSGVKPIPQTKEVEWEGGLPPVGEECEAYCYSSSSWVKVKALDATTGHDEVAVTTIRDDGLFGRLFWAVKFRKPESPEAKKEREELESAYDLYCHAIKESLIGGVIESFEVFCGVVMTLCREEYLSIVRKTGYRVEK